MRQIKFRGKKIDNEKWVYGYYFKTPLTDEATGSKPEDGWYFLSGRERHCIAQNNCVYEVIPETIGQYTGLKDNNCKEIYEGDIIRFIKENCIVNFVEDDCAFRVDVNSRISTALRKGHSKDYEIIGNIYENYELLEAKNE